MRLKGWLGYSNIPDGQVQYRNNSHGGKVEITVGQLASKVAKVLRTSLRNAGEKWVRDPMDPTRGRYCVGLGPNEISEGDLILLGVIFVSPGAITPLLRLRDDFVFAPSYPIFELF